MVEYAASFGVRIVIFTSGIKRPRKLDQLVIDYYYNKMQEHIKEIELHEPWNHRLMDNIRKYYENLMNPNTFSPIEKSELKKLKDLGLSKIVFDYQAYEHETDEFLMGRDRVKHACLLDSMLNASVIGIETDVHFIPMKPNYKEIPDILEMLEIGKIDNISILNFVPQGRGLKNVSDLILDDSELLDFMKLLDSIKIPDEKHVVLTDGDVQLVYENGEFFLISTVDSTAAKSPLFSIAGPLLVLKFEPNSFAII